MSAFKERYESLNKEQKRAVDCLEGPVLVVAGPGTGKTEILSLRVANILHCTDASPGNILCLTFTESAAINMRRRLAGLIGQDAYRVAIHTFHSFGVEIIHRYPEFFYDGAPFSPADEVSQIEILGDIIGKLPYDNPLRKEHIEMGYIYLGHCQKAIGQLKKAGLTPEEFGAVLIHNTKSLEFLNPHIETVFESRISKKILDQVEALVQVLESYKDDGFPAAHMRPLTPVIADSIKRALRDCEADGRTTLLSEWKERYTKKNEQGRRVFRDTLYVEKLLALSEIYKEYKAKMYARRYYDFDDMLLETIQSVGRNKVLIYELGEQYRHILVDEFQDTNDAQMRLLGLIANAGINGGKPNVMVVGDDDQAIYKFQGAEISNILHFRKTYQEPQIITLTDNYRSTQDILDLGRHIILKGRERLENLIPGIKKLLVAAKKQLESGDVISKAFPTNLHEYCWVAKEIKRLIQSGKNPGDIAVISRQHKQLEDMALYLSGEDIPLSYERHRDVFHEPHVHQLIQIARYVTTLCRKKVDEADELLPEILSYPFWGLGRKAVWDISVRARGSGREESRWLDVMLSHENKGISRLAEFFLELASCAACETLEHVLDKMMGAHVSLLPESEKEDEKEENTETITNFVSPFREYYFSRERFEKDRTNYLSFLSSLRVFVHAVREYRRGVRLKADHLVEFVELHERSNIPLTDQSPFVSAHDAVNLLTAHKAKGLEFDTVFVIGCQEDVWAGRGRGSNLSFPQNLPIAPAGENLDDHLRLFYVAITRAKHRLYLTSYKIADTGKESLRLQFIMPSGADGQVKNQKVLSVLQEKEIETDVGTVPDTFDVLTIPWEAYHRPPFAREEEAMLKLLLKNYRMSVVHLNNFLNVANGGPQLFLEQNLLRFPQAKSPPSSFGSAMHRAIELIYRNLRKDGAIPSLERVLVWFEEELVNQRLSDRDFVVYRDRGRAALTAFYTQRINTFDPSHFIEVDFKDQGVVIGNAAITGIVDKIVKVGPTEIVVHDFKTGKAKDRWHGGNQYDKEQLHNYFRQLVFYKILIENSRGFGGKYRVNTGVLEFLEPLKDKVVDLRAEIKAEDVERTRMLVEVVYDKIHNLNFPDTSRYSQDVSGILAFEDDLLNGKV